MSPKVTQLIEYSVQDVVKIIATEKACSVASAMRAFYASKVYAGLADPETGLYLESPSYLYELYQRMG